MLKKQGLAVLERLEKHGYEAYFVGGCVRDWLLERPVHDIDICTNAHPGDVMRIFPRHVPTGLQHGTVAVKQGGFFFEVTTFRREAAYTDYRRPDQVYFVSDIRTDLARRDFTMNAIAMDRHGRLVDPFFGQTDIKQQIIRAVGDPLERFQEDPLRLLRAVRFAAQLGFRVEQRTREAVAESAPLLRNIAVERITSELHQLLDAPHPHLGVELLVEGAVLQRFPLLQASIIKAQPFAPRLTLVENYLQKWCLLLFAAQVEHDQAGEVLGSLKLSRRERQVISTLLTMLAHINPVWDKPTTVEWKRLLLLFDQEMCYQAARLLQAIWANAATGRDTDREWMPVEALQSAERQMPITSVKELAITGRQLQQELGKQPGQWIAVVLERLLFLVALHGLPNEPASLLERAKKEVLLLESDQADHFDHI